MIEDLPDDLVVYFTEQEMLPLEERDCTECMGLKCHLCDNTGTFIRQWGKQCKDAWTALDNGIQRSFDPQDFGDELPREEVVTEITSFESGEQALVPHRPRSNR